jgi:uncharacterized protein (TIGR02145 family)
MQASYMFAVFLNIKTTKNRKMKNKFLFIHLFLIGLLFTTLNSCEKNDSIVKKDVVIMWANPADISLGTALSATQLNAVTDVSGTFVYTPAIGTVLDIGNQELNVVFTPTDAVNYNVASKTVTINVNTKKSPVITWANPTEIASGTALSNIQLNAVADVSGTFVYTPAIGTVLDIGNQELKAVFTPTDAVNYNVASKIVTINVTQGISSAVFNNTKTYGTMTDQNGNTYKTIVIGTQTWMAENLRVTKYRNGDPIPNSTNNAAWIALTTGSYCNYDNATDNDKINTFGRLYNWYAVNDSRNIAPTGWHVPTDAEWTTLITYLGGQSLAGGNLKEIGTTHWISPNDGADNASGFTALPGGYRGTNGEFFTFGFTGHWWSSSVYDAANAWGLYVNCFDANASRYSKGKSYGFSVRCVKD